MSQDAGRGSDNVETMLEGPEVTEQDLEALGEGPDAGREQLEVRAQQPEDKS